MKTSPIRRIIQSARWVVTRIDWVTAAQIVFCAAVVVLIGLTQKLVSVDQLDSPLYRATLEKTFDRFREDDVVVPYQRGNAVLGEGVAEPIGGDRTGEAASKTTSDSATDAANWTTASARFDAKDYAGALTLLAPLRARYPRDTNLLHKIADALRQTGRDAEAIDTYRDVLRINPDYNCCREHIRDLYEHSGRQGLANQLDLTIEREYRRLAAQSGNDGVIGRRGLVRHLSERKSDHVEAIALALRLVEEAATDVDFLLAARCLARGGRPTDALAMLDKIRGGDAEKAAAARLRAQLTGSAAPHEGPSESSPSGDDH